LLKEIHETAADTDARDQGDQYQHQRSAREHGNQQFVDEFQFHCIPSTDYILHQPRHANNNQGEISSFSSYLILIRSLMWNLKKPPAN
jgi:hypothetical protein